MDYSESKPLLLSVANEDQANGRLTPDLRGYAQDGRYEKPQRMAGANA